MKNKSKVNGALFGVAVGDALGGPLEFMTAEDISRKYGYVDKMLGGGWLGLKPGEVTDDTQMTIAVANGISKCTHHIKETLKYQENPEAAFNEIMSNSEMIDEIMVSIGDEIIKWYHSHPKDIGNTCRVSIGNAIANMAKGMSDKQAWMSAAKSARKALQGKAGGNGTLMRTIYPAVYFDDVEVAVKVAREQSMLTHDDATAADCCEEYVRMVFHALRIDASEARAMIRHRVYELSSTLLPVLNDTYIQPTGYVVNSFAVALQAVSRSSSFSEAVTFAVNKGGDADTIGAITGGLAGAVWGFREIPTNWIECLEESTVKKLNNLVYHACEV